eukprot:sb/3479664/
MNFLFCNLDTGIFFPLYKRYYYPYVLAPTGALAWWGNFITKDLTVILILCPPPIPKIDELELCREVARVLVETKLKRSEIKHHNDELCDSTEGNIKFLEFEENIRVNKPKEGFLKLSSFLVMRTVYFFTSLARCLRMFPCFIRDENLVKVAPNDCLCSPKNILELSRKRCIKFWGVQSLFCETRIFEKERNSLYLKNGSEGKEELQEQKRNYPVKLKCVYSLLDLVPCPGGIHARYFINDLLYERISDIINFPRYVPETKLSGLAVPRRI